jgi:hypothetical protein
MRLPRFRQKVYTEAVDPLANPLSLRRGYEIVTHSARPTTANQMHPFLSLLYGCAAAVFALLLVGCDGSGGNAIAPTASSSPVAAASPSAASTPSAPLPAPVANAQQRAAADAGVSVEQVLVVRYDRVEFPSAALGCPAQGKGYAQVITPGYSVQLRVGEHDEEYHTNLEQAVVRCLSNTP